MRCWRLGRNSGENFASIFPGDLLNKIAGDKLTLKNAEGQATAVFTAQSQDLQGTSWQVTGYNDGSAVSGALSGTTLSVAFRTDGRRLTLYKTDGSVAVYLKRD